MRSRVLVVLAVVIAALVSGGVAAFAGGSDRSGGRSLTVQIETQKLTFVDTGPTGFSPGDMIVEEDNLTRAGNPFGTASVTCIAHEGNLVNGSAQCSGTFYLPKGRLQTQGDAKSLNGSISGAGAVTGGTGRYEGVDGAYAFDTTTGTTRVLRFELLR